MSKPRFSVKWAESAACYEARFWSSGWYDTQRRVPPEEWAEYGLKPPTAPSPRAERIALTWAADLAPKIEQAQKGKAQAEKRKLNLRETLELMIRENPRDSSPKTIAKWRVDFANLESTIGGELLPEEVDIAIATRHRNLRRKQEEPPRERTIANELALLRQLVLFAWKWKRVTHCAGVELTDLPATEDEETQQIALTLEEIKTLLEKRTHFHAKRDAEWMLFGISTLLRREVLVSLEWSELDLEKGWISIPKEKMKGRKRALELPLPNIAIAALPDRGDSRYVWPNPETGLPYTRIYDSLRDWYTTAKVRPFSMHDWRTTGSTILYENGVDELTRAVLAGHVSTLGHTRKKGSVTNSYVRAMESHLRATQSIFDAVLLPVAKPVLGTSWEPGQAVSIN